MTGNILSVMLLGENNLLLGRLPSVAKAYMMNAPKFGSGVAVSCYIMSMCVRVRECVCVCVCDTMYVCVCVCTCTYM